MARMGAAVSSACALGAILAGASLNDSDTPHSSAGPAAVYAVKLTHGVQKRKKMLGEAGAVGDSVGAVEVRIAEAVPVVAGNVRYNYKTR